MISDLIIGQSLDLIIDFDENDVVDLYVGVGALTVAQGASLAIRAEKKSVWFNLPYGIDREALFSVESEIILGSEELYPLRVAQFTDQINKIEYASIPTDSVFTFEKIDDTVRITIPCVNIDCGEKLTTSVSAII